MSDDKVRQQAAGKLIAQLYDEFMGKNPPAAIQYLRTVQYFDSNDPGDPANWTTQTWTYPQEPEWEYVEDFAGHKVYRRVWGDGREQWTANAGPFSVVFRPPETRLEVRRAILRNRNMPVRRAADGGLVGWRYWVLPRLAGASITEDIQQLINPSFDVSLPSTLRSPHRGTIWDGPTLSAFEWSDEAACEGNAGIHALSSSLAIPAYSPPALYYGSVHITGRVRGYGRYVLGTRGWRAERVVIDYLRVPNDVYDEVKGPLSERYQCDIRKQWR